jgi:caffeoyl-CoA O-methyltransferase
MMVGLLEGQFLGALVRSTGAKRILELGTFTGYSSISMALALPGDGRLVTCDVNPETTEIARRYAAYLNYYEATLPKLAPRGLMILDNTLWSGRVADPEENDENTRAIREVNDHILADPRVNNVLLTVRDGMNLVWRA